METLTAELTYAQALFDAAKDLDKVDKIGEEFKFVADVIRGAPELKKLLLIPTLSAYEKKQAAEKIFAPYICRELMNFICILIDKHRYGLWEGIGKQYERLVWERAGLTKGVVYTALPLDPKRLGEFEEKTGAALNKKVKLENHVDVTIIGGAKIYVDGKLIDASIKTRLEGMKQRIRL